MMNINWRNASILIAIITVVLLVVALPTKGYAEKETRRDYAGEVHITDNVGGDRNTVRFYDSEMKVWCWKTGANQGGIACIPEWELEDPYGKFTTEEQRRIKEHEDGSQSVFIQK